MSDNHEIKIPTPALVGAGLLMAVTVFVAATADNGGVRVPGNDVVAPQDRLALSFKDRTQGGVEVIDAETGQVLDVFEPGGDGFARGVVRGLVRERRARGLTAETAFELQRHPDGRLTLSDPETGQSIELVSFGKDNVGAFAEYLKRGA